MWVRDPRNDALRLGYASQRHPRKAERRAKRKMAKKAKRRNRR